MKWIIIFCLGFAWLISLGYANEVEMYITQGDNYTNQGFYDEAIALYQKALAFDSRSAQTYRALGIAYAKKGDFDKPIDYYQSIAQKNPNSAQANYELGVAYENKKETDRAIEYFQKAIQINPAYAEAYHSLGDVYGIRGEYEKEAAYLRKALRLNPHYGIDIYYIHEIPYGRKIIYYKAIESFKKAVEIDPGFIEAYYDLAELYRNLAKIYSREVNLYNAVKYWQKIIRLKPDNAKVYYILGTTFWEMGNNDKAIYYLYKAIQRGYNNPVAIYYNLSSLYLARSEYNRAIKSLQNIICIKPEDAEAHYRLGWAYGLKRNKAAVLKQSDRLRKLNRNDLAEKLSRFLGGNIL